MILHISYIEIILLKIYLLGMIIGTMNNYHY
jgi:hypothetical protein